ncbi:hypothetical protein Tco_1003542, partial [Tanacetum coccineum]
MMTTLGTIKVLFGFRVSVERNSIKKIGGSEGRGLSAITDILTLFQLIQFSEAPTSQDSQASRFALKGRNRALESLIPPEINSMAEQNVPAQPPTRTDEQIVPRSQWLTIGKSNLLFNAQKIQKNPIFQISVDILKNTNFFQALTASANVPAIYLQQFWKTMSYNEKTGVYSCQLDEQWFDLSADLLRKGKPTFKLVDEDDEDRQETIPHEEGNDPDLELAMKLSLEMPQEKGEGEGDDADLERAIKLSLDPALLPQGGAPVRGITIREPGSEATPKLQEVVGKGKAVVTEEQVAHSLVNLSKKKRTNEQFVFARHDQTPPD